MTERTATMVDEFNNTGSTIQPSDKKKIKIFNWVWNFLKVSYMKLKTLSKNVLITIFLLASVGLILLNTTERGGKILLWGEAAFSSPTSSYTMDIGNVNARFTKTFWIIGIPEVKFKSHIINGSLNSEGDMNFTLDVPGGPYGDIEGIVSIKPTLDKNSQGLYKFMGDGIAGSFIVSKVNNEPKISNFNMNINWDLVGK